VLINQFSNTFLLAIILEFKKRAPQTSCPISDYKCFEKKKKKKTFIDFGNAV
jgi:hypothetical protein